jgi:hypothetical protein
LKVRSPSLTQKKKQVILSGAVLVNTVVGIFVENYDVSAREGREREGGWREVERVRAASERI